MSLWPDEDQLHVHLLIGRIPANWCKTSPLLVCIDHEYSC